MLNQVQIIGYLGKDPETRFMPSGDAVCNFSIATTEKWKDKATGEPREITEWHRCSTFGGLAEICGKYLKKGSLAFVQGKIQTRKYTDKDGAEKFSTEIKVDQMKMLGGREGGEQGGSQQSAPARPAKSDEPPMTPNPKSSGFDDLEEDFPF